MKRNIKIDYWHTVILIDIILLIFRLLWEFYRKMPLNSDEAQYWLWSRNLALSYYSKPPLIAYLNYLSTLILGNTVMGIRINTILVGFILPLVHYKLAEELFHDQKVAFWSVCVLLVMPHYSYISMVFTTDSLVLLCWSVVMLFSFRTLTRNRDTDWIIAGIFIGLGVLGKYTMILWIPVWILAGLFMHKQLLKIPQFYISLIIVFLVCLPMLYWNISNSFIGAKHVLGLMGANRPPIEWGHAIGRSVGYLGGQLACLSPFLIFPFYTVFKKWVRKRIEDDYIAITYLVVSVFFVWLFFLVLSVRRNDINWTFFSFTAIPLLTGYSLVRFFRWKSRLIMVLASAALIGIILFPSCLDRVGMKKVYPPKIDLYHKQAGWDQLGNDVSAIIKKNRNPRKVFIFSNTYQIASELAFYVDGQPQTYCINNERRMNQFDLWPGIDQFKNRDYDAVYVSARPVPDWLRLSFNNCELITMRKRIYRDEETNSPFFIYKFTGFLGIKKHSVSERY